MSRKQSSPVKKAATKAKKAPARPAPKKSKPAKPAAKAKPGKATKPATRKPVRAGGGAVAKKTVKPTAKAKVVKPASAKATAGKAPAKPAPQAAPAKPNKPVTKPASAKATAGKAPAKPAPQHAPAKPNKPATKPASANAAAGKAPAKPAAKPVASAKAAPPKAQAAVKEAEIAAVAPAPKAPAPKPAAPAAKVKAPAKPKEPILAVMTGIDPLSGPARLTKRAAKERFVLEHYMRTSINALYDMISTPSGFSEWFCDDVNVRGDEFTFVWGNDVQQALCIGRKHGELMRFHFEDDDDAGAYFELRIRVDPMTNDVALVVTDHAWPKDLPEAKALWESQVANLARVLGA
jgi:hypothetical protein